MELLLNLFWVMLAIPAALIWWRERRFARNLGHLCFSPSLVSLVCLLALLFPVVSATDDMQAMRGGSRRLQPRETRGEAVGKRAISDVGLRRRIARTTDSSDFVPT